MNTPEEAAFETSLYHYFLFKAQQAEDVAKRAPSKHNNSNATSPPATNDAETFTTDANDKQDNDADDGNKKLPAKETPSEMERNNPPDSNEKSNNAPAAPFPPPQQQQPYPPPGMPFPSGQFPPFGQYPGMVPPAGAYPPIAPQHHMMPPPFVAAPFPGPPARPPVAMAPPGVSASPPQPPATASPLGQSQAQALAGKYKRVAQVICQEFPDHAAKIPPTAASVPPDSWMRFTLYPKAQHELNFMRYEKQLAEQQEAKGGGGGRRRKKKALTMPPVGTPIPAVEPTSTRYARIATRKDVPEDVKELIFNVRKELSSEKHSLKRKIERLEAKVVLTQEKAKKKQARSAAPPPPVVPVATPPPLKPRASPPKPPGPPATFESRYKELEDYKRANNTCRVPLRAGALGRWVADLRKNYRHLKEHPEAPIPDEANGKQLTAAELTKERLDKLDEIGFEFDVAKKAIPWQTRFEQMLEFKAQKGHCNVPRHWKEDPTLGEWVHRQREAYSKGEKCMNGERTDKLNAVGFMWRTGKNGGEKVSWEQRLEQCRNFRRVHGHLNVPPPVDPAKKKKAAEKGETLPEDEGLTDEERGFRWWAFRQRDYRRHFDAGKKSTLDKKRIKELDQLGFDWETRGYAGGTNARRVRRDKEVYTERVAQLQRVKDLHGDCNNIRNIEKVFPREEERKPLLTWAKSQRKQWKNWKSGATSSLTDERRQMLENVEFDFEPRKHYAPYGSKKKEMADELEPVATENDEDMDSTMRDYQYIQQ